jgi:hypothetical protein
MNQCGGCQARMPTKPSIAGSDLHVDEHGRAFMACERDKYELVTCLSCGSTRERDQQCCGH